MERLDRVLRPRRGQPGDGAGDAGRGPPAVAADQVRFLPVCMTGLLHLFSRDREGPWSL